MLQNKQRYDHEWYGFGREVIARQLDRLRKATKSYV
jgi:hypothetical protein